MSSANRRLVIFLPHLLTFQSCSPRASDMIRSRKMLKRVGNRRHTYLSVPTPIGLLRKKANFESFINLVFNLLSVKYLIKIEKSENMKNEI